jgi:cytochrome c553
MENSITMNALRRTALRRCSKKHAKELATYRILRLAYISENPICEMQGCHKQATQIHHKAKRGKNLNAIDTWLACCASCHARIEDNKTWARAEGYLK